MNPSTFIAPCPLFCFLFNCFLEHQHFKSVSTTCRIMPSSWINVFLLQWNSWVFLAPWCALCVTRRIAVLFLGNSWACHSPGKTKEENHFSLVSLLYPLSWSSFNCPPRFCFFAVSPEQKVLLLLETAASQNTDAHRTTRAEGKRRLLNGGTNSRGMRCGLRSFISASRWCYCWFRDHSVTRV